MSSFGYPNDFSSISNSVTHSVPPLQFTYTKYKDVFRFDYNKVNHTVTIHWGLDASLYNIVDSVDSFCWLPRISDLKRKYQFTVYEHFPVDEMWTCIDLKFTSESWKNVEKAIDELVTYLKFHRDQYELSTQLL